VLSLASGMTEDCAFVSGIVPESLFNLLNGFNLCIAKLLAKFNAITLLNSFHHFALIDNPPSAHNTYAIIDLMLATDAVSLKYSSKEEK
jgi:hypothetical protein